MSLPELDLKKDEKSKLILSVAQKLKLAKKPWDDFAKLYHKYSQALLGVAAIGKQVTEQLNTIGALHKGDVGENIARMSGVQAAIDQKLEAISNCIEIELVTPIQNSLAPDQQSVAVFEKEFVKNSENIGAQLKKIEAQTKKVGKKGNNDDLMTVMSQFKNKITELDNWKGDSLKRVFLLERKRFCELLNTCCKVSQAELDLAHTIETYETLLPQWNATVATAEVLPDELLKKFTTQGGLMQLTTAESASVQLANTTDQRIQNMQRGGVNEFAPPSDLPPPPPGSSGSYDYDQSSASYDTYSNDYSNGYSNGYDDAPPPPDLDPPPPPFSAPPPPPMSSPPPPMNTPPPPPVKKMANTPPSYSPRTPRESMPPNSMPPPPPVKKMGNVPPPPMSTPPPPSFNTNGPKAPPRASQQLSPGPPRHAPPPPNVKASPPPPMTTPPPPPLNKAPPMSPKSGPPTPPSIPKGAGAPPPPPPAPKAPGPPPPPPVSASSSKKSKAKDDDDDHGGGGGGGRNALLSSINSFKKGGLKKAVTNDRSGPNLTQPKGGGGGGGMRGGMPPMF